MANPSTKHESAEVAASVLAALCEPGRLLVFCDESQIDGHPVERLVADLRIMCAITMQPARYAAVSSSFADLLATFEPRPDEFHATEIVNPPKSSKWKGISADGRMAALRLLCQALRSVDHLYYCHVSKGQFAHLKELAASQGAVSVQFVAGLKRVFLRTLFEQLSTSDIPCVVVVDASKPQPQPQVHLGDGGDYLVAGGPIVANSAKVFGLQLADFAAFAMTRYLRVRDAVAAGGGTPRDELIVQAIASLADKTTSLLNAPEAT